MHSLTYLFGVSSLDILCGRLEIPNNAVLHIRRQLKDFNFIDILWKGAHDLLVATYEWIEVSIVVPNDNMNKVVFALYYDGFYTTKMLVVTDFLDYHKSKIYWWRTARTILKQLKSSQNVFRILFTWAAPIPLEIGRRGQSSD